MKTKITIVILCLVGCFFVGYKTLDINLDKIKRVEDTLTVAPENEDFERDSNPGLPEITTRKKEPTTLADEKLIKPFLDDNLINILLVGQDRRPGEGRQRSDTMVVCSINVETKQVALISFLRDLYVSIPGYSDNRLNAAYVFGGFPLLTATLKENFGITIDGCFEVDFNGFKALIDQIGGVDIELTSAEAKIVGGNTTEGKCHLSGKQALTYARIRKIDSDFQRTNRQRKVLLAAYKKVKNESLGKMVFAIQTALPYLTTDMTNKQIMALGTKLFPLLKNAKIDSYHVPPYGTYSDVYINGMAVLYPDLYAIREILEDEYLPLSKGVPETAETKKIFMDN